LYDGIRLILNPANSAPLTVGGALYDAKYRACQTALLVSITGRKYANSPNGFSAAPVRSAVARSRRLRHGGRHPAEGCDDPAGGGANLGSSSRSSTTATTSASPLRRPGGLAPRPLLFARLRLAE